MPTISDMHLIAAELIGKPDITGETGTGGAPVITYAYTFANADVAVHDEGRVALLTAWLRSPAQFETTFAMESFIDELAAAAGQDTLAFRLAYLEDPRAIGVLKAAAAKYGWVSRPAGGKKPDGRGKPVQGRGIAWVNRDDARVATIADVTVDPASGKIKVGRVVVAHDCGLVVNPDGLRNQVEGNVIQSLSRSLHEEVTFDRAHLAGLSDPALLRDSGPHRCGVGEQPAGIPVLRRWRALDESDGGGDQQRRLRCDRRALAADAVPPRSGEGDDGLRSDIASCARKRSM